MNNKALEMGTICVKLFSINFLKTALSGCFSLTVSQIIPAYIHLRSTQAGLDASFLCWVWTRRLNRINVSEKRRLGKCCNVKGNLENISYRQAERRYIVIYCIRVRQTWLNKLIPPPPQLPCLQTGTRTAAELNGQLYTLDLTLHVNVVRVSTLPSASRVCVWP